MTSRSGYYACNVSHWHHVLEGFKDAGLTSILHGQLTLSPSTASRIEKFIPGSGLSALVHRRTRSADVDRMWLGIGELILPTLVHSGLPVTPFARRLSLRMQALQVADAVKKYRPRVVQFVDGLGHRLVSASSDQLVVCERRNLHPDAFTQDFRPIGSVPFQRLARDPVMSFLDHEFNLADKILVYSNVARASFLDRGFQDARIVVAPLPVRELPPANSGVTDIARSGLLFVGRAEVSKGIDIAVSCAARSGRRLTVAGPAHADVRSWLSKLDHVTYVGPVTRQEFSNLLAVSEAFIMPSIESYGLAVLEAAASGVPVVAAETTGAAEHLLLTNEGLCGSRDDIATFDLAIERAVRSWTDDPGLPSRLRLRARSLNVSHCARLWREALNV